MHHCYRKGLQSLGLACSAILILAVTACNVPSRPPVGETRTTSQSIPLGQQKSVDVEIKMGAGELSVESGSSDLMDADFTYNVDAWKPEVRYDANGPRGILTIEQPSGSHNFRGRTRYNWDIRLNRQVPMEMNVDMGAGKSNLELAGLNLNRFALNAGAGEADIDLDGAWQHDLTAVIHGGVGKVTLHLPSDVGVRATIHGGLGAVHANEFSKNGDTYTNSAFGKSKVNLEIQVEGGLGEVNLQLGGGRTI